MSEELKAGQVPVDALPVGFRGPDHLVTSGSNPMPGINLQGAVDQPNSVLIADFYKDLTEPPIPYRQNLKVGSAPNVSAMAALNWGVRFDMQRSIGVGFGKMCLLQQRW